MPKPRNSFTDDDVKQKILEYFYNSYRNPRGMSSYKIPIKKVLSDLKIKGLERAQVIRNMIFLVEHEWLKKEEVASQYDTGLRTVPSKKTFYYISSLGIDYFEKPSRFQRENILGGINITNTGIITIGNNNYVRAEYSNLFESLDGLGKQIRLSNELSDEDKVSCQSEIETIKAQLVKTNPDKSIVKRAWDALKVVSTINGLIGMYQRVEPIITALLH
ncbi:MAG: hypothetical protein ACQCN4_11600 [Candidatus Bathyarchaeia archaeon]|jgi:hypothetical protein